MSRNKKMLCIYAVGMTILPILVSLLFDGIHCIGLKIGINLISDEQGLMLTNLSIYLIFVISIFCLFGKVLNSDWKRVKEKFISSLLKYGMLLWMTGIAARNIAALLGTETTGNQETVEKMYASSWIISLVIFCILAPIVEEMIFRYIIMGHFLKKGVVLAIIISSVLFGALHLTELNFLEFLPYFADGLFLGFVYNKTKSITICISIHCFNNTISLLLSFMLMLL